ncbi:MAG: hypothetical protein WD669_03330 [Pirellulales bacterium]
MANTSVIDRPIEVGVFDSVDAASRAVEGLLAAGFTVEQITVICSDETKERKFHAFEHQEPAGTYGVKATVAGSALGALVGGLAVIASAVATGGVAILAAGPISAAAGGVAGGFIGAMMTRGVEKELANFYQQSVLQGRILVAAEDKGPHAQQSLARAARILADAGALPLPLDEG